MNLFRVLKCTFNDCYCVILFCFSHVLMCFNQSEVCKSWFSDSKKIQDNFEITTIDYWCLIVVQALPILNFSSKPIVLSAFAKYHVTAFTNRAGGGFSQNWNFDWKPYFNRKPVSIYFYSFIYSVSIFYHDSSCANE